VSLLDGKSATKFGHSRHISFLSRLSGLADLTRNSSGVFCRICHEGEQGGERLISPCRCAGTVGVVHRSCVEMWLSTANQDTCEICQQKYLISRHPRPIAQWLCEPKVGDDHHNLVGDFVCFLLLTPLAAISTYLCGSGAAYYFQQDKRSEAVGLICLTSLLILIYLFWLLLSVRYHCQVWFKWRLTHQDIRLLEEDHPKPTLKVPQTPAIIRVLEESNSSCQQITGTTSPVTVSPLVLSRSSPAQYLANLAEDGEVSTLVKPLEVSREISKEVLQQRDSLMSDLRHHLLVHRDRQVVTQLPPGAVGSDELKPEGDFTGAPDVPSTSRATVWENQPTRNGHMFKPPVPPKPSILSNTVPVEGELDLTLQ